MTATDSTPAAIDSLGEFMLPDPTQPRVQVALARAAAEVGAIPKDDLNKDQGFKYRGIERILAAAGPALHRHGVVVLPRVLHVERDTMERGAQRNVWRLVSLTVEYAFVGPAGDCLKTMVLGEGLDNTDKAVSKAMTMAYKVALLQALQIADAETDPDASTPPDQAPVVPVAALLSDRNVKAVRDRATEAGLSEAEVGEMVLLATANRTQVLEEALATEVAPLRDAMKAVVERKARDPRMDPNSHASIIGQGDMEPPDPDEADDWLSHFAPLAPSVQARVDPTATAKPTAKQYRDLVGGLKALGVEADDDQRRALGVLLGTTVHSRGALTGSQVASVLAELRVALAEAEG